MIVCYKDYWREDPVYISNPNSPDTTYLWRELPPGNANPAISRPENQLIGVMYDSYNNNDIGADFVVENSNHWIYANSGLQNGSHVPGIVGYEWDKRYSNGLEPARLVELSSSSPINFNKVTSTSNATIYQLSNGAWVFSTGSIYWSYALDYISGYGPNRSLTNGGIQQVTKNVLDRISVTATPLPIISALSPNTSVQMEAPFTLSLNGSNFVNGATVNWQGAPRPTAYINASQLTAQIGAADILTAGNWQVTVTNPNGNTSDPVTFVVTVPIVTNPTDAGEVLSSNTSGTLSYALKHVHAGDAITFSGLGSNNTVTVTGKLPFIPTGVFLDGGNCSGGSIIINGSGVSQNGLVLMGNVHLKHITVQGFGGKQVINGMSGNNLPLGGNRLECSSFNK
ncbi:MAG: hypothetical protein HXX08_23830 [Chloroflexi bacterium]|uniref:N,N-dimethylformamidase beta subunit-like C-terminal domain-containing protein n=1 Tax=Candidatus Chlorohelix allophototropha TaxID=3003348 RepID=A0A8T7MAG1_9CHLR|nr:hypothetical protein [Chloroflexota bacterium]WJW68833.1 hypothetical protein OZ401_004452 [Chloroflexota bacterium L227-S17]